MIPHLLFLKRNVVEPIFSIDVRNLTFFRFTLALVMLYDLSLRIRDISAFYTDAGVLPRQFVTITLPQGFFFFFSLHFISGTLAIQELLFALQAIVALALMVGYRTRIATFLLWILHASLLIRNPLVDNGGDLLLLLLLFWSIFLPLGEYLSVDSKWKKLPVKSISIFSASSAALLLQVGFVYFFTASKKTGSAWHSSGTAIYYALHLPILTTRFSALLSSHFTVLQLLTHYVFFMERFGIFFLFLPFLNGKIKTFVIFIFISLHIGLGMFLYLQIFPLVSIVGFLPFFPPWFWEKIISAFSSRPSSLKRFSLFSAQTISFSHHLTYPVFSRMRDLVVCLLVLYTFFWNVYTLPGKGPIPDILKPISYGTLLGQNWSMFAPFPPTERTWFVIPATLKNKTVVNLMTERPFNGWDEPSYTNFPRRWRNYLIDIFAYYSTTKNYHAYADYLCRQWNQKTTENRKIDKLQIYLINQPISFNNTQFAATRVFLGEDFCSM